MLCLTDQSFCVFMDIFQPSGKATHTESMTIQPTSGGVAPLYNPLTPSLRTVCSTQSNGPRKCPSWLVCKRTLIVSNLRNPSMVNL